MQGVGQAKISQWWDIHTSYLLSFVPEPVKVNPLGLAGGEEESLFQKELSEGS